MLARSMVSSWQGEEKMLLQAALGCKNIVEINYPDKPHFYSLEESGNLDGTVKIKRVLTYKTSANVLYGQVSRGTAVEAAGPVNGIPCSCAVESHPTISLDLSGCTCISVESGGIRSEVNNARPAGVRLGIGGCSLRTALHHCVRLPLFKNEIS